MNTIATPYSEHTLRNEQRDFVEWHLGRPHYALWALMPDCAALERRVQAAQTHLGRWLLGGYQRQPHITLSLCGFPSACATQGDDFEAGVLRAQLLALRQLRPAPFEISIGALESFSSAPYLTVQTPPLRALRQCLLSNATINMAPDDYTAHVTVGLYGGAWPLSELRQAFDRFSDTESLQLQISSIALLSYAARDIGGPLQRLAEYDFSSGRLHWSACANEWPASFRSIT